MRASLETLPPGFACAVLSAYIMLPCFIYLHESLDMTSYRISSLTPCRIIYLSSADHTKLSHNFLFLSLHWLLGGSVLNLQATSNLFNMCVMDIHLTFDFLFFCLHLFSLPLISLLA